MMKAATPKRLSYLVSWPSRKSIDHGNDGIAYLLTSPKLLSKFDSELTLTMAVDVAQDPMEVAHFRSSAYI